MLIGFLLLSFVHCIQHTHWKILSFCFSSGHQQSSWVTFHPENVCPYWAYQFSLPLFWHRKFEWYKVCLLSKFFFLVRYYLNLNLKPTLLSVRGNGNKILKISSVNIFVVVVSSWFFMQVFLFFFENQIANRKVTWYTLIIYFLIN